MKWNQSTTSGSQSTNNEQPQDSWEYDEFWLKDLRDALAPRTEAEKQAQIKLWKQQGFQAACNDDASNKHFENEIYHFRSCWYADATAWLSHYQSLFITLTQQRTEVERQIGEIKDGQKKYDVEIDACKAKEKELSLALDELKKKAKAVRETLEGSNITLGAYLIANAEQELQKIAELQQKLYKDGQPVNETFHSNIKQALNSLIKRWENIRTGFDKQYQDLTLKLEQIHKLGINQTIAFVLIGLGTGMAGAAGHFFSIFSKNTEFSADDVFSFVFQSTLATIGGSSTNPHIKVLYFIGALGVITLLSWGVDRLLGIASRFQDHPGDGTYSMTTAFQMEGFSYHQNNTSKRWYISWLKILPVLLVLGCIVLLLSYGSRTLDNAKDLNNSTGGLLVGSTIAMGFAASLYLYMSKIIESRPPAIGLKGHLKRNWELSLSLVVFLFSIAIMALHKKGSLIEMYSIAGFIGTCLTGAFSIAYGLRFWSLQAFANVLESRIQELDVRIAQYSVPAQALYSVNTDAYINEVCERLMEHFDVTAKSLLHPGKILQLPAISLRQKDGKGDKRWYSFSDSPHTKQPESHSTLFIVEEWQVHCFPALVTQLKLLAGEYAELLRTIELIKTELRDCIARRDEKLHADEIKISKLESKCQQINRTILKAQQLAVINDIKLRRALEEAIVYLRDGFQLGLQYRKNGDKSEDA